MWLQNRTPESRSDYDDDEIVSTQCKRKAKQEMQVKTGNDQEADLQRGKKYSCRHKGANKITKNFKDM